MNTLRNLLLVAGITITGITACNYTVGECWPVGQGGGSSGETVTAGGGVIIPTGPSGGGGFGDEPPGPPQGATDPGLKCNKDDDSDTDGATESTNDTTAENNCSAGEAGSLAICRDGCAGTCGVNGGPFAPGIFKFVTIVPDDGTGTAGGWQEAATKLRIIRYYPLIVEVWYCPVKIGIPLRTTLNGKISPEYAALVSTQAANQAANKIKKQSPDLPQGIFCLSMIAEMKNFFSSPQYKTLGASVN